MTGTGNQLLLLCTYGNGLSKPTKSSLLECFLDNTSLLLGSDVVFWLIWLVWSQVVLSAGTSIGSSIIMPLKVSICEALQLLGSDVVISVLSEWIGPSLGL